MSDHRPRRLSVIAALLLLGIGCAAARVPDPATDASQSVVTAFSTTVSDLELSTRFLTGILGATIEDTQDLSGGEVGGLVDSGR